MTLNVGVTDDQIGQFYRRVAAVADRLGKSLPFDEVMQMLQRVHDRDFKGSEEVVSRLPSCLVNETDIYLEAHGRVDPLTFFSRLPNVSVTFENEVSRKSQQSNRVCASKWKSYDLDRPLNDSEIKAYLPKRHVFNPDSLGRRLQGLLERMKLDKARTPLVMGSGSNLFYINGPSTYTKGFVVELKYSSEKDECWFASTYELDSNIHKKGSRVFIPIDS